MADTLSRSCLAPAFIPTEGPKHSQLSRHAGSRRSLWRADGRSGQVEDVSDRVNAAQKLWSKMNCTCRTKILHSVADAIERADMTDIATMMPREIGKANGNIANIRPVFCY